MLYPLAPDVDESILDSPTPEFDPRKVPTSAYGPPLSLRADYVSIVRAYGLPQRAATVAAGPWSASTTTTRAAAKRPRDGEGLPAAAASSSSSPLLSSSTAAEAEGGPFVPYSKIEGSNDYQGRSFLHPPAELEAAAQVVSTTKARIPSRPLFALKGHTSGIQAVQWYRPYGHLLFSSDLDGQTRLWDGTSRKQLGLYVGHRTPVRSLQVGQLRMSTASIDGAVRSWDIESGTLLHSLVHTSQKPVLNHAHHPTSTNSESPVIVAAVQSLIVLWDVRASTSRVQREYTGHLGAVLHLGFMDGQGRTFVSTAEDKSLRTWDLRVPVQIQTDSMPFPLSHIVAHPTDPSYLAAQSMDNKVIVLQHDEFKGKLKVVKGKTFEGHQVAGSGCHLDFSHDGSLLSSGDVNGEVHVWKWATGEKVRSFAAHSKMAVSHAWHPAEAGRMVTSGWDTVIKMWK